MSGKIIALCGKTGSGKTSYATKLELEHGFLRFSIDEWMILLFGHTMERENFDRSFMNCQKLIFRTSKDVAKKGCDVVLDFGFWQRKNRLEMRKLFEKSGLKVELHYLRCDDMTLRQRLQHRNANINLRTTYKITEDMFDIFSKKFEPPQEDENPIILRQ